jgi:hypothetical protein
MVAPGNEAQDVLGTGDEGRPAFAGHFGGVVVCVLVGVLVGVLGTLAWNHLRRDAGGPARQRFDVRVSLAAHAGTLDTGRWGRPVVVVPVVVVNEGPRPLTLVAINVTGPGAAFVPDLPGGPPAGLPRVLPPRRPVSVRFGLSADCSEPLLPEPRVRLVLRSGRSIRRQPVAIPDLIGVWGQVRLPEACAR